MTRVERARVYPGPSVEGREAEESAARRHFYVITAAGTTIRAVSMHSVDGLPTGHTSLIDRMHEKIGFHC